LTPTQTIRARQPTQGQRKKKNNKSNATNNTKSSAKMINTMNNADSTASRDGKEGEGTSSGPQKAAPKGQTSRGGNNNKKNKNNNRRRNNRGKPPPVTAATPPTLDGTPTSQDGGGNTAKPNALKKSNNKKGRKSKKNKMNQAKRFPWRAEIPQGSVDPITLDPLDRLPYPPFALAAQAPYDPVPEWPIPPKEQGPQSSAPDKEDESKRQERILREQWGASFPLPHTDGSTPRPVAPPDSVDQRHCNLYDGRALAYYMVSQLQFIDPLNRRDVTRDELINLDQYLRRHGFLNINVTEAFDAKGVTLSTAGSAAHTAAGRAQILQQEAAVLLQALFGGTSVSSGNQPPRNSDTNNRLAQQYQAYEAQQQQQQTDPSAYLESNRGAGGDDLGISGDNAGILVIDDDMNPGLRGDAPVFMPSSTSTVNAVSTGSLWSASHIAARHNHAARLQAHEFPSLAAPTSTGSSPSTRDSKQPSKPLPKTNTLSKISGVVKQTTPEERQRQWEAREAMKRKAALSNLTFGSNAILPSSTDAASSLLTPPPEAARMQATEGQVERNRALADALGVLPATLRQQNINSGWARPTDPLKEFGEELQSTIYPDSLILQARERLALVLKMEKKWMSFLKDDKAASLPLQPMDRATRTFVHQYSDHWNLHTESFDKEPQRYIHCVKKRETMAPYPLLSVAVRQWKGPRPFLTEHPVQQTTGQTTRQVVGMNTRSLPEPPSRQPLQLKPPSTAVVSKIPTEAFTLSGAKPLTEEEKVSSRFDGLAPERPKLQLQPRTAPLDMPPFASRTEESSFDAQELLRRQQERMQEKARQEQAAVDAKRRALEAAFASDSEDDVRSAASRDSDEWVEQEPLYQGSDEEA
jgi:hypothetical protein